MYVVNIGDITSSVVMSNTPKKLCCSTSNEESDGELEEDIKCKPDVDPCDKIISYIKRNEVCPIIIIIINYVYM